MLSAVQAFRYPSYVQDIMGDIFSLGCVIAEMFNKGQELFDLSNLLRYCNDDAYECSALNRIEDPRVRVGVAAVSEA